MVCVVHLFVLHIYTSSFGTAGRAGREIWHAAFLSEAGYEKAFHRLAVQDVRKLNSD
jgi:hypothetical protein